RVKPSHLLERCRIKWVWISEFGPDVTQVDPSDVSHSLATARLDPSEGVNEAAHLGIVDWFGSLLHQILERSDQDRHNRERPAPSEQILEENDLELDRMLCPVAQLILKQIRAGLLGDAIDVGLVGRDQPQGSGKVLASQREPVPAILMRDSQND